jgi:hypothetical protein
MSITLGASFMERLCDSVRLKPFRVCEIRRIKGMGVMYFSLSSTLVDQDMYIEVWSLSIDGIGYTFYRRNFN